MAGHRLLIVEDDIDIAHQFKLYLEHYGYEVEVAWRGSDALEKTRQILPHLIVLDIMLPDIDGYEVCRTLRTSTRTGHIPIVFLTQKDERSDKLQGLEIGADDYITKPMDIEEFRQRIENALKRSAKELLANACTGLPAGRLIEDTLRRFIRERGWAFLDVGINHIESFKDVYGFAAGDDVLKFAAMLIGEVVDELGAYSDFIGHPGNDSFIIISRYDNPAALKLRLKERFDNEVTTHYDFMDRQQGFIQAPAFDGTIHNVPFMNLSVGVVSSDDLGSFDMREIMERAAEARRQDSGTDHLVEERLRHILKKKGWAYLHLQIRHFKAYQEIYEISDTSEVIQIAAKTIKDVIRELEIADTFMSHPEQDSFVIIMPDTLAEHFRGKVKTRFDDRIISKYFYIHRRQGYIRTKDRERHAFMKLAVGIASTTNHVFLNTKEMIEFAQNACSGDVR